MGRQKQSLSIDLGRVPAARAADGLREFTPLAPKPAMLQSRTIDQKMGWWSARTSQGLEKRDPHALGSPVSNGFED